MKTLFHYLLILSMLLLGSIACSTSRTISSGDGETINQGYTKQKKRNKTTAIDQKEVDPKDASLTMADLLSRVSGVSVMGSGRNLKVTVRGRNSINMSSDPLFVVDGRVMGYGFESVDFLEPSMIKSISVLKDGASAAEYGTRGANGVILIDLKKN